MSRSWHFNCLSFPWWYVNIYQIHELNDQNNDKCFPLCTFFKLRNQKSTLIFSIKCEVIFIFEKLCYAFDIFYVCFSYLSCRWENKIMNCFTVNNILFRRINIHYGNKNGSLCFLAKKNFTMYWVYNCFLIC